MRVVVETGTDIATLAAGDVSELSDVMGTGGVRPKQAIERAVADGRLWRTATGGDGAYLFHVFVDEDPPDSLRAFLYDAVVMDPFPVPSGKLLVGGEEVHIGALPLSKARGMAEIVPVAPGVYGLTAYRVEAPDDYLETRLNVVATPEQAAAWRKGSAAIPACVWGTMASAVVAYQLYTRWHAGPTALLAFVPVVVAWLWTRWYLRQPAYVAGERLWRAVEREMPSVVLVLRASSAGGTTRVS